MLAKWRHYFANRNEGNVLFNDALSTFYLLLNGITHMVKYHSNSEREETLCRHLGYSSRLAARFFYMHHTTDRITHTTAFVTPVVEGRKEGNVLLKYFPLYNQIKKKYICHKYVYKKVLPPPRILIRVRP